MIIYSLRLAIFGSRFHPVRCRCCHPSWLDKSQRILLWGLPDLSPKDTRTWWLSGEQVLPCATSFFWKGRKGHFIALLLYSDDAKPAGWFSRKINETHYSENGLPAFSFQVFMSQGYLWGWHPTAVLPEHEVCCCGKNIFKERFLNHAAMSIQTECRELSLCQGDVWLRCVISNHAAKVETKCAVFLRS